jgi:hypothetical protein
LNGEAIGFEITYRTMTAKRQTRYASWRALCATLALLFGAMAAPVALAGSSSADICAMACCVEKGHCCCKPRHAFVEGQTADGRPRLAATEIAAPCPEGCAAPSASSTFLKRQALRPADYRINLAAVSFSHLLLSAVRTQATASASAAPRAPPFLSIRQAA